MSIPLRVGFDPGITVIESPFVDAGQLYVIDGDPPKIVVRDAVDFWATWERKRRAREAARAIVQEGMLDILVWLTEANGGRWPYMEPPATPKVAAEIAAVESRHEATYEPAPDWELPRRGRWLPPGWLDAWRYTRPDGDR